MADIQVWTTDSYAKINLGLHVLQRLPNGFHEIETGLAWINWYDSFRIRKSRENLLVMSNPDIPADDSNLIMKALNLITETHGVTSRFMVEVTKRIPAGAGLGGGSSNAAATLRFVNKIENLGLSEKQLWDLASQLGSDVPFFLTPTTAIASGTGTELRTASIQPKHWVLTVFPNVHSSTADVYSICEPQGDPGYSLEPLLDEEPDEWTVFLKNDLEPPAMILRPEIGHVKDQLQVIGASYTAMSGSGSAVFGVFEQEFVATAAYKEMVELGYPCNLTEPGFIPDLGIYQLG